MTYGPCLDWSLTVDVPCEKGWSWDDHPLLLCRALKELGLAADESEVLEDDAEAAVSALLAERATAGPVVVSSRPAEEPPPEERLTLLPPAPPPPASRVRPAAVFLGWAAFGWLLMFGLSCLR